MGVNAIFQALSDPTRREILRMLRSGDKSAGDISRRFRLAKSTLSGHFNVLKSAGLILPERRGTTIVYSLNVTAAEDALSALMNVIHGSAAKARAKQ